MRRCIKMQPAIAAIALIGLFMLLVAACSSDASRSLLDQDTETTSGDDADVQIRDTGSSDAQDISSDTDALDGSPFDGAVDVSDTDTSVLGDDFFECDCPDPQAVCREQEFCCSRNPIWCARPDLDCNENDDCPDGFLCNYDGFCECRHSRDCAPRCQSNDDCRGYAKCDPLDSICVQPPPCSSDNNCVAGEWCVEVPDFGEICTETGSKQPGEECSDELECDSGICDVNSAECARRCNKESDCPDGQECTYYHEEKYVCDSTSYCQVDCPDGYCAEDECQSARCLRSGDCANGNCVLQPIIGYSDPGTCDHNVEEYCKDNEFQYGNDDGVYCRVPINCSVDGEESCPPPYKCRDNGNPEGNGYRTSCARRLDGN